MSIGQGARAWAAYPALSAPLTMMGVERRWFLLSATVGMAMWNAINSTLIGAATFCVLYGVGWWAWRMDPHMLTILRESVRFKTRRQTILATNTKVLGCGTIRDKAGRMRDRPHVCWVLCGAGLPKGSVPLSHLRRQVPDRLRRAVAAHDVRGQGRSQVSRLAGGYGPI